MTRFYDGQWDAGTISINADVQVAFAAYAKRKGTSMRKIIEAFVETLPVPDVVALDVSDNVYRAATKAAETSGRPVRDVMDSAIARFLDDAEKYPLPPPRRHTASRFNRPCGSRAAARTEIGEVLPAPKPRSVGVLCGKCGVDWARHSTPDAVAHATELQQQRDLKAKMDAIATAALALGSDKSFLYIEGVPDEMLKLAASVYGERIKFESMDGKTERSVVEDIDHGGAAFVLCGVDRPGGRR